MSGNIDGRGQGVSPLPGIHHRRSSQPDGREKGCDFLFQCIPLFDFQFLNGYLGITGLIGLMLTMDDVGFFFGIIGGNVAVVLKNSNLAKVFH